MARRNTHMSGSASYYPQAPDIEAAKHLRNMAAAYVRRRANAGDVEEAIADFRFALQKAQAPTP